MLLNRLTFFISDMRNKIPYIISASSLALILLIIIQVKWMHQSRRLIEEQFDQKVNMALCTAVSDFANESDHTTEVLKCRAPQNKDDSCCSDRIGQFVASNNIEEELKNALALYSIDLPFEFSVSEADDQPELNKSCLPEDRLYSCSLSPLLNNDELDLNINFPGKQAYVLKKMGLMLGLSILIMLFITGVFVYANYHLVQQKNLSERNKEFFNHMAHEFKTPLTNIGLASNMLLKRKNDPLVQIISSENRQLSDQVNKVLSLASLESGQFEIDKQVISVKSLIREVIDNMQIQIQSVGASISTKGFDDDLRILGDPFHLANAIKNLVENALKYNDRKPIVEITSRQVDQDILISVQDNGIGINSKNQNLIFEKFYRIDQSEASPNKGFGLGLSYVRKIISLHGGNINMFSVWKKGTRFEMTLPLAH